MTRVSISRSQVQFRTVVESDPIHLPHRYVTITATRQPLMSPPPLSHYQCLWLQVALCHRVSQVCHSSSLVSVLTVCQPVRAIDCGSCIIYYLISFCLLSGSSAATDTSSAATKGFSFNSGSNTAFSASTFSFKSGELVVITFHHLSVCLRRLSVCAGCLSAQPVHLALQYITP